MKLKDFKTLCRKYGLVCGTLDEFKGEVPDKALKEIDAALEIVSNGKYNILQYFESDLFTFKSIKIVELNDEFYKYKFEMMKDELIHFHFRKPYQGDGVKFYDSRRERERIFFGHDVSGIYVIPESNIHPEQMLIAASPNLMSNIQVSFKEIPAPKSVIEDDPIVFQILSHGIVMIHSKWGDESNDPMLEERKL